MSVVWDPYAAWMLYTGKHPKKSNGISAETTCFSILLKGKESNQSLVLDAKACLKLAKKHDLVLFLGKVLIVNEKIPVGRKDFERTLLSRFLSHFSFR